MDSSTTTLTISIGKSQEIVVMFGSTNYIFLQRSMIRDSVQADQQKVLLIDYEMGFWAPRGIDIGSHWVNRMIKWNGIDTKVSGHAFPSEDQRTLFVKEYLKELQRINPKRFNEDERDTEQHVMMEADFGVLFFTLFFSTILMKHSINFSREPSFLTVIPVFQSVYQKHKELCFKKYKNWQTVAGKV